MRSYIWTQLKKAVRPGSVTWYTRCRRPNGLQSWVAQDASHNATLWTRLDPDRTKARQYASDGIGYDQLQTHHSRLYNCASRKRAVSWWFCWLFYNDLLTDPLCRWHERFQLLDCEHIAAFLCGNCPLLDYIQPIARGLPPKTSFRVEGR